MDSDPMGAQEIQGYGAGILGNRRPTREMERLEREKSVPAGCLGGGIST